MSKKKGIGAELGQAMPAPDAGPDDYQTKDHLQTLLKAHEIMNNPAHLKAVHKLAGRHAKGIKSIQDIKDYTQDKFGSHKKSGVGALKGPMDDNDTDGDQGSQV